MSDSGTISLAGSFAAFAVSALRLAMPLQLALLGETLTQRTGVVNLGVEGQMLVGAMTGYAATALSGNPWLGLGAGCAAGAALSLVHAFLVLWARADAFASGLATWMLGYGLSAYFGSRFVGDRIDGFAGVQVPGISGLTPTVLIALAVGPVVSAWFWHVRGGLYWRAVGEAPEAARAAGLRPTWIRLQSVVVGGLFSGLGGAALSVDITRTWAEGMSEGRGLVAVGLVIVARWNPWLTLPAALVFGGAEALALRLQAGGLAVSAPLLQTLPYVLSLAVMTASFAITRTGGVPGALRSPGVS